MTDTHPHLTLLHSSAANCLLFEADPGPAEINIGSELEPHMVPRRHAWRDFYAHALIINVNADPALLEECSVWARELQDSPDAGVSVAEHNEARLFWLCAVEIADRAIEIVGSSGAATDTRARERLLASCLHMQTQAGFGAVSSDVAAQSTAAFIERLDQIDRNPN